MCGCHAGSKMGQMFPLFGLTVKGRTRKAAMKANLSD